MSDIRKLNTISTQIAWNDDLYLGKLQDSLNWIENLGIHIPPSGRHRQYERVLKKLSDKGLSNNLPRPSPSDDPKTVTARYETHELDRIIRYFRNQELAGIRLKFSDVLDGHFHFYEETGGANSHARNTLAELTAGSYYLKYELSVSYGDDLYPEPMVIADGSIYATQCKRLSSRSKSAAGRNLKKAAKQIDSNLQRNTKISGGIIFVDMSNILLPHGLIAAVPRATPIQNNYARKSMVTFMRDHVFSFPWDEYPNVHGIILRGAYFVNSAEDEFSLDTYVNQIMYRERPGGCSLIRKLADPDQIKTNDYAHYNTSNSTTLVND